MIRDDPMRSRYGVMAGVAAGLVAIGCCVGPAVAVLLGITTAAVAVDLANSLYSEWGWAFKLGGLITGVTAVGLATRARRRCRVWRHHVWRYALVVGAIGVVTYGALYALTTWLGALADG